MGRSGQSTDARLGLAAGDGRSIRGRSHRRPRSLCGAGFVRPDQAFGEHADYSSGPWLGVGQFVRPFRVGGRRERGRFIGGFGLPVNPEFDREPTDAEIVREFRVIALIVLAGLGVGAMVHFRFF